MSGFALPASRPFVLLENRLEPGGAALLYQTPLSVVCCDQPSQVDSAFGRIEAGLAAGQHAAGFCAYELGYALEPRLARLMPNGRVLPLIWMGLFEPPLAVAADQLDEAFARLGPPAPLGAVVAELDAEAHAAKVRQIQALIAAGDIYQANLTFKMTFTSRGDPLRLYGALRASQPTAHGGLVFSDDLAILSVSPELWIETRDGVATCRPMKGTAARQADPAADAEAKRRLLSDPKQRAENLMITDLLRNDLSRIAEAGSVSTPALFTVETYPSFHALTSTVTARLRPRANLKARFAALFPCGSIVGAPKIRAAEVIRDREAEPRGVYTGALGAIRPSGDMAFNVAIRTAVVGAAGQGEYGVGGGIIADSAPAAEYEEALLKARALTGLAQDYQLIETLGWTGAQGFVRLQRHVARMAASAACLGFEFDRDGVEAALDLESRAWTAANAEPRRVRVVLSRDGSIVIDSAPLEPSASRPLRVGLARERLDAGDPFLRHKTSRRALHESAFAAASRCGLDEALLLNRRGLVAEASRNTIFARVDGRLITPPLASGVLPGVLRQMLLDTDQAVEAELTLEQLRRAESWSLGNSLRGLRAATLVAPAGASLIWSNRPDR